MKVLPGGANPQAISGALAPSAHESWSDCWWDCHPCKSCAPDATGDALLVKWSL